MIGFNSFIWASSRCLQLKSSISLRTCMATSFAQVCKAALAFFGGSFMETCLAVAGFDRSPLLIQVYSLLLEPLLQPLLQRSHCFGQGVRLVVLEVQNAVIYSWFMVWSCD